MSKRHILKSKINGKRAGNMNYRKNHYIILNLGFQKKKEIENDILEVLSRYFDIVDLSEKSNKRGRGSITRSTSLKACPTEKN